MGLLGAFGYLYLTLLAFLLIIGFGLAGLQLISYLFVSKEQKSGSKHGGTQGKSSPWQRMLLISLLSLVLITLVLLLSNPWYQTGSNHHF